MIEHIIHDLNGGEKASKECPNCHSKRNWKDGIRENSNGFVQRFICRDCGYRFSESSVLSINLGNSGSRQVCAILTEAKNLATATESKTVAGEIGKTQQDAKGKLVAFMIRLNNDGIKQNTIENYGKMLRILTERGANLLDPESVKEAIAKQKTWAESSKELSAIIYGKFADLNGIKWKPPSYKSNRKVPFIPLENEIDALIAHCGRKLSAVLKLLKESGLRIGEALRLEWKDIDVKNCTVTLNKPEKYGVCRIFRVSNELIAMLNTLPKDSDRIFGNRALSSWEGSFSIQRRRASIKLQNPRLIQIHFHTFRHWKATMEYAKTKDILHVMKLLGHRSLENTLIYTQLVNFETNEYHSATAKTIEEAKQLIESGFEYVCTIEDVQLFRKRK